jgi:Bacteriophage T4 gp9/10-like protein
MSRIGINTGTIANDGTGDSLRVGASKINDNFTEIYTVLGTGTDLQVGYGKTVIGIGTTTGNLGIGVSNPQYALSVISAGATSTVGLANALADFTSYVNLYSQVNVRNSFSGSNASSDLVVTADTGTDTTNYLDLGINNSGFSTATWTINGPVDGYLYTSNSNLSIGVATNTKYLSFFVGGTLASNEQIRVTTSGVGIATTNPTGTLQVGSGTSTFIVTGIGSVGIGTAVPTGTLQVGSGTSTFIVTGIGSVGIGTAVPTGTLQVGSGTSTFIVTGIGSVGIGTANPQQALHVQGNLRVSGSIRNSSMIAFTVAFGS